MAKRRRDLRWLVLVGVVALVIAAGLAARWLLQPTVTVTPAGRGPVIQAFYATGTVEPHREFPVKSNVEGIVTEVMVNKGDRVEVGAPLVRVTNPTLEYEQQRAAAVLTEKQAIVEPTLREYDARIEAMQRRLQIAEREQDRVLSLLEAASASPQDADFAADRVASLTADLATLTAEKERTRLSMEREIATAQAALASATWYVEQQTVRSPVSGTVLDRPVPVGTRVAINDVLLNAADVRPEHLVMRAAVDEEDIAGVAVGQVVEMSLYSFPAERWLGGLCIYDEADEQRRTFEVDLQFEDPPAALAAGMSGELAFVLDRRASAVTVPAQAVQHGSLWAVRDGRVARLDVDLGLSSVERYEIRSGLDVGDEVIVSPIEPDAAGRAVRVETIATPEAEPLETAAL